MSNNENTAIETEQVDSPLSPTPLDTWHSPKLKSMQIGVATEAICDASNPCA